MHPETAISCTSRNYSRTSGKLTSQALAGVEMNENEIIKICVRTLDKATISQLTSGKKGN
jgi:hypothetical protein